MFCHFDNYYSVAAVEHVKCSVYLVLRMHLVRRLGYACVRIDYKIERQHLDIVVVVDTKLYFCCVELLLLCVESVEPHSYYIGCIYYNNMSTASLCRHLVATCTFS